MHIDEREPHLTDHLLVASKRMFVYSSLLFGGTDMHSKYGAIGWVPKYLYCNCRSLDPDKCKSGEYRLILQCIYRSAAGNTWVKRPREVGGVIDV